MSPWLLGGLAMGIAAKNILGGRETVDALEWDHLTDPKWEEATRVHDWRNHVPDYVRTLWPSFHLQQQQALFDWADALANYEEWE